MVVLNRHGLEQPFHLRKGLLSPIAPLGVCGSYGKNIRTTGLVKLPGVGSRPGNKLRVFALGRLCVMRVEKLVIHNLNIEVRIFKAFSF